MADRPLKVQDCLPSTEPDRILLITASVQHGARKRDFQNLVDWKPPAVGPVDHPGIRRPMVEIDGPLGINVDIDTTLLYRYPTRPGQRMLLEQYDPP